MLAFRKMTVFLRYYVTALYLIKFHIRAGGLCLQESQSHICVIGGGYSGLASARYLKQYGLNFTVYEASRDIGGTWRFDPLVGTDEYGVPIFTSQYKHLRTNTPRHTMEFNGFPFPENTSTFPSGKCFFKYLKSFARKFDLTKYVKCYDTLGYKYIQPFIHENAELRPTETFEIPLHRNIVNIHHPTMALIGVIGRVLTRVLDAQAQYAASLAAGKFKLPSKDQMMNMSFTNKCTLGLYKRTTDSASNPVKALNDYFITLTEEAGIDGVPPVLVKMKNFTVRHRLDDLLNYREYDYQVIDNDEFKSWYNLRNVTCGVEDGTLPNYQDEWVVLRG